MDRIAPTLFVKIRTNTGEEFRLISDRVLSFKYKDRERKQDVATLTVENGFLQNFDDPVWRKGAHLLLRWGYPGNMTPEREVCITSVKGFKELKVEAVSVSVRMNRVQKCRVFENQSPTRAARTIAEENGWGPDVQHVDDVDEVMEVITQSNLTDAQFLRRWASRLGFEFYVDFDGFHFHRRRVESRPVRVFRYHTDPNQGDILAEPTIENDLTARPGRTRVRGRNPMTREDIDEGADNDSDSDRPTLTEITEIIDPDTGRSLGDRVEGNLASEETVPTADATPTAARRRARGRFRRTQQTAVKMKFPVVGDPQLFAKSVCQVEGMGQRLSVRYYMKEVEHDLNPNGYVCRLDVVSDGHGGHSTRSRSAVGLSLIAGRGPGSGRGRNRDVENRLRAALQAAEANNDTQSADTIRRVLAGYQRGGNRTRAEATRALASVAGNSNADEATRQAAASAASSFTQRGAEVETGGNPNRQDAAEDSGETLEPFTAVDPDSGQTVTRWRQAPTRGTTTGGEE